MIYEVTRSNGLPLFFQGSDKDEKRYTIKVSIFLEKNDRVENYKDFVIPIDEWDLSFYYYLILLNDIEISKFKDQKKGGSENDK
ncbi:MAG: hypothetical protein RXO36_06375 [Candidatus Nanopusillus acidilobi]